MRLIFKYDLEKEYTNFSVAFKSINHSAPSKIQKLFYESYQDLNKENVIKFVGQHVKQNNISMAEKIKDISGAVAEWRFCVILRRNDEESQNFFV